MDIFTFKLYMFTAFLANMLVLSGALINNLPLAYGGFVILILAIIRVRCIVYEINRSKPETSKV